MSISTGRRPLPPGGFARSFRGDTDFTQTKHLDRWDGAAMRFIFGIDAMPNLSALAEELRPRPKLWNVRPGTR